MNRSNNNNRRVYVGNLPSNIDERDLEDIFYKYGDIADVDLKLPRYGTGGTPFAFVEFQDPRYAHKYVMYFFWTLWNTLHDILLNSLDGRFSRLQGVRVSISFVTLRSRRLC